MQYPVIAGAHETWRRILLHSYPAVYGSHSPPTYLQSSNFETRSTQGRIMCGDKRARGPDKIIFRILWKIVSAERL